jgi:ABC-2 type transport system permease protein
MFVFFIMTGIVESVMDERTTGSFRRIIASPVSKAKIIIGKFFPYYIVNILQIVVMFAIGVIFYNMELGNSFGGLLLVTLTLPLVSTTAGMFISTICKTKNQGTSIVVISTLVLAAFGGIFIPAFLLPDAMQLFAKYTPMGTALMAYQDILVRNLGVSAVLDNILILLTFAFFFFLLAIWRFKFEE